MSPPSPPHTQPAQPAPRKSIDQAQPKPPPVRKDLPPAKRISAVPKSVTPPTEQKKASHRSSKPIINWFQRKLAGGSSLVRSKRAENQQPPDATYPQGRPGAIPLRVTNRIASAPLPSANGKHLTKLDVARRKTISLNEEEDGEMYANDMVSEHSSIARDSTWSPTSANEADEDASLRPLPPSAPPSPSPSSSSYISDPRTFRSIAVSTKPTTLLSIDLNGNGMAHIAQAPPNPINRLHVRSSSTNTTPAVVGSGTSITFSALPPSPVSASMDAARNHPSNPSSSQTTPHGNGPVSSVQAPLHTTHHPRNNPRPSSPPLDNASVLTLASSAYAIPGRAGVNTPGWSSAPPSALGDSLSHFGGSITYADAESTSQYLLGDDDVDASVRALRPRSSRRGSWESEASRWSARVQQGGVGTPSLARDGRSLWTSNSIRTGGENVEMYEKSDEDHRSDVASQVDDQSAKAAPDPLDVEQADLVSPKSDSEPTPKGVLQGGEAYLQALRVPLPADTEDIVPGGGTKVGYAETADDVVAVKVDVAEGETPQDGKDEEYDDATPNERTAPLA